MSSSFEEEKVDLAGIDPSHLEDVGPVHHASSSLNGVKDITYKQWMNARLFLNILIIGLGMGLFGYVRSLESVGYASF